MPDQIARARRHSLSDLPRRSAARTPGKPAIACGGAHYSFAEFDALCTRVAAGLGAKGIAAGDRVAILSRNSHAFAAIRFALARLRAVLVPINFMLKPPEIAYVLRHSGARLLCIDANSAETGRAAALDSAIEALVGLPSEGTGEPDTAFMTGS